MARWPAVAVALCLLVVTGGMAPGAAGAPTGFPAVDAAQQFDRTQFQITVFANGSARWTFHYERTLANESERAQFEAFAADFTETETRLYADFRNQTRTLVARGDDVTDREMAAVGFDRRAFVTTQLNDVGVVEMAFTWRGFARLDGDRVVVGDVFEGGLYVGPAQSLVVRAGTDVAFVSVEPAGVQSGGTLATSDSVTWEGERTFTDNRPRVVLTTGDVGATATDGAGSDPTGALWPVALVLAVVVAGLGGFLYRRRSAGPAAPGGAASSAPAVEETALLDDEERIEGLLTEHGGRMRQSAIVEATGWSKSKVSMVLTEMEAAGQVRKLRVGRENIVSLPGHEPDAAGSALDDTE